MLRVRDASKSYLKRTIRELYGFHQATPKSVFLDVAWDRSVAIWPGMVMSRTSGENVTLFGASPLNVAYGLCCNYIGGDGIDELLNAGLNVMAVWVLNRDAEFEILAPAYDTAATWTDPGDGTEVLITALTTGANRGKLTTTGANSGNAIARLLKVNSATKITIGGLR